MFRPRTTGNPAYSNTPQPRTLSNGPIYIYPYRRSYIPNISEGMHIYYFLTKKKNFFLRLNHCNLAPFLSVHHIPHHLHTPLSLPYPNPTITSPPLHLSKPLSAASPRQITHTHTTLPPSPGPPLPYSFTPSTHHAPAVRTTLPTSFAPHVNT